MDPSWGWLPKPNGCQFKILLYTFKLAWLTSFGSKKSFELSTVRLTVKLTKEFVIGSHWKGSMRTTTYALSRTGILCEIVILFCLLQGAGISGIKVHRITRVHNRILRTKFDDKLDQILDRDDIVELTKYEPIFDRLLIFSTSIL